MEQNNGTIIHDLALKAYALAEGLEMLAELLDEDLNLILEDEEE